MYNIQNILYSVHLSFAEWNVLGINAAETIMRPNLLLLFQSAKSVPLLADVQRARNARFTVSPTKLGDVWRSMAVTPSTTVTSGTRETAADGAASYQSQGHKSIQTLSLLVKKIFLTIFTQ